VNDCRAGQEASNSHNSGNAHIKAPPECKKSNNRKAQVRKTDFPLERAVLPTDEPRRRLTEKDMKDEVIKITKGNRKKNEVRKDRLYELAACPRAGCSHQ